MKASDISIPTFISVENKKELESSGKFNQVAGGIPYTSDASDYLDSPEYRLNGKCEQFDLAKSEDRNSYADLCAKFLTPGGYTQLWEQRVPKQDGGMIVYVTYTELSKISYNTAMELKGKEDK